MTISLVLFTTICAAVVIKIFHELYKLYEYSVIMNKIPGPRAYPLLGNLPTLLSISREGKKCMRQLYAHIDHKEKSFFGKDHEYPQNTKQPRIYKKNPYVIAFKQCLRLTY